MSAVAIQGAELDELRLWVMMATNHLHYLAKYANLDEHDRQMCVQIDEKLSVLQMLLYPTNKSEEKQ